MSITLTADGVVFSWIAFFLAGLVIGYWMA